MIDAFKSTLEELTYTDIILLVIDISDSVFELKKKFSSCMRTLSELGVEQDKIIYVLNKDDLLKQDEINRKIDILNLSENKKVISVSAKTGKNVNELKKLIKNITMSQNSYNFNKNLFEGVKETFGN
jgi:GTP-binding protein HflX